MNYALQEITSYLENIAPLRFQENYDNAGLILGQADMEIRGIILALDCTEEVVKEAIVHDCNLVIAHHPIIFRGIKKFDTQSYVDKSIIAAIKNDVAIYAIHTNLDNVLRFGVNEKIGQKLGIMDMRPLRLHPNDRFEADYTVGSGIFGRLPGPMEEEAFLSMVKEKMGAPVIRHTALLGKAVEHVAICGGAGSFLVKDALGAGADVFVTSDMKYHEFFDANGRMVIADIGHYESEQYTIELIFELVKKKFPNFAARCTKVTTNPVRYH